MFSYNMEKCWIIFTSSPKHCTKVCSPSVWAWIVFLFYVINNAAPYGQFCIIENYLLALFQWHMCVQYKFLFLWANSNHIYFFKSLYFCMRFYLLPFHELITQTCTIINLNLSPRSIVYFGEWNLSAIYFKVGNS